MLSDLQSLLDRVRRHNEEARLVSQAASDLATERQAIIAAFGELGIKQRRAEKELVHLDCRIRDVTTGSASPQTQEAEGNGAQAPEAPPAGQTRAADIEIGPDPALVRSGADPFPTLPPFGQGPADTFAEIRTGVEAAAEKPFDPVADRPAFLTRAKGVA